VPTTPAVAFAVGTIIKLRQGAAGVITISGDNGVTVNSLDSAKTFSGQYATAYLEKIATNTWALSGDLETYLQIVQGLKPIAFWPLNEPVTTSGTGSVKDNSGNMRDATPTNVTFGVAGIGDGNTAASFNGTSAAIAGISTSLQNAYRGAEGAVTFFFQLASWGYVASAICDLLADGNNRVIAWRTDAGNSFQFVHKAGGTVRNFDVTVSSTAWLFGAIVWSESGGYVRAYLNGVLVGEAVPGTFAGTLVAAQIGNASGDFWWPGQIAHFAMYGYAISETQIRSLARAAGYVGVAPVFFGDSIVAGLNASDAAHRWINIVAAAQGWTNFYNSGIGATTLQNTVQNTVLTIGAAVNNNGRDTYTTRVSVYAPSWVFILYGLNDITLNDAALSVANFQNDLGEIVDALIANGTPAQQIVIGSPPYIPSYTLNSPWDGGSLGDHAAHVAACAAVAAAKGTKYVDVYAYMAAHGGAALVSVDGVHPNDAGHAAIAAAMLAAL
jgi:lysophospholipase L1-like esterase